MRFVKTSSTSGAHCQLQAPRAAVYHLACAEAVKTDVVPAPPSSSSTPLLEHGSLKPLCFDGLIDSRACRFLQLLRRF